MHGQPGASGAEGSESTGREAQGAHRVAVVVAVGEGDVAAGKRAIEGHVGDVGEQVYSLHGGARGEDTRARVLRRGLVRVQPVPAAPVWYSHTSTLCMNGSLELPCLAALCTADGMLSIGFPGRDSAMRR